MGKLIINYNTALSNGYTKKQVDKIKLKAFNKLSLHNKRGLITNLIINDNQDIFTMMWDHGKTRK